MVHYFKNEWRWDVDIKDTFDIYTKTIISPGSKSTLGSTTKKLEFGDDKKLDLVRTNVSFYYDATRQDSPSGINISKVREEKAPAIMILNSHEIGAKFRQ